MIGDWFTAWPSVIAAIAVIFLPGLAIGFVLRLRGLALWALAPAAGVVVMSVLAIVLGAVGIAWSPLSAGVGCLVVVGLAFAVGLLFRTVQLPPAVVSRGWLLPTALAAGAILGAVRVILYIGEPDAISQTNDAVFHLNALRWITESGSASSFHLSQVTGSRLFYPAAWHAVASLTSMLSGSAIPVAVNAVSLVTAVVVWPLGTAWLTREAARSTAAAAAAAVLSSALIAFPMLMLEWGVLYPNLLSVALLPAAVGVVVAAPRWISAGEDARQSARVAILTATLLLGALGAVALAQPATLMAWLILAVSFFSWWALPWAMRGPARRRGVVASVAGAWLVSIVLWYFLTRQTTGSHWPPFEGKLAVLADVLLNGHVMLPFAIGVSAFMIVGLVRAVIEPSLRWFATGWLILSGLYIVTASIGQPFLRRWLVGAWYADPYRMTALIPVVVVPLAAIGLTWTVGWLTARFRHRAGDAADSDRGARESTLTGALSTGVATVIVIIGLVVAPVVMMPRVIENEWDEESRYASGPDSWLSPEERSILEGLSDLVPADARVIANPSTGSGFGYMLSGRDVYPRTWAHPRTPEWRIISDSLRDAGTDPAVCDALEAYGSPEFVLDFGEGEATPGRFVLPGMTDFEGQPGFELIAREGDASLWRLTACR